MIKQYSSNSKGILNIFKQSASTCLHEPSGCVTTIPERLAHWFPLRPYAWKCPNILVLYLCWKMWFYLFYLSYSMFFFSILGRHPFLHAAILSSIISLTSSKRKNLLVLNVTVLGVLVQAVFALKWPALPTKNPFLQAAIRSSLQGKEKICSCCTLIFPLGVLAEGLLQRPFYPFEWLELPRRCKICISQARTH